MYPLSVFFEVSTDSFGTVLLTLPPIYELHEDRASEVVETALQMPENGPSHGGALRRKRG